MGPFALDTRRRGVSTGFAHPDPGRRAAAGPPPDLLVLVGDDGIEPGIAYGLQLVAARLERAGGGTSELTHFTNTGPSHSMFGVFANPVEEPTPEALARIDLGVGDRVIAEFRLWVGDRADVASVTDQLFPGAPLVSGRLDDAGARLHVHGLDGKGAFTEVRPDADGAFRVRLPEGSYQLLARGPAGREVSRRLSVPAGAAKPQAIALGAPARVALPRAGPMRLVFVGILGTPDPELRGDLLGRRVGSAGFDASARSNDVSLAGLPGDPGSVELAPGAYRVYATRGPEYTLTHADLQVAAGAEQALEIAAPVRALETPGWISADFHVHSALSFDSGLAERLRVASFLAQGAEVLVATEHDRIVDYAPLIGELGADPWMTSLVGVEITGSVRTPQAPHAIGHANAFPVLFRPELYQGGAPRSEGVRLRAAIAEVRALGGERVFQVNHPRKASGEQDDEAFFSHLSNGAGFDPALPLDRGPNAALLERDPETGLRDLDFDAVELMNGESMDYYRRVRADWFSFLLQGEKLTGTANSDSHRLRSLVGLPRTYVRVADDRASALDKGELIRAVLAGQAFGTTGPWLAVELGGVGPGGTFRGREGTLAVAVRAAPWVPVSTARVYVNGALAAEQPAARDARVELPLAFPADAFVTVEVEGVADEAYRAVAPGFTPFAFSNPIWIDADADGAWTPPGLPAF